MLVTILRQQKMERNEITKCQSKFFFLSNALLFSFVNTCRTDQQGGREGGRDLLKKFNMLFIMEMVKVLEALEVEEVEAEEDQEETYQELRQGRNWMQHSVSLTTKT